MNAKQRWTKKKIKKTAKALVYHVFFVITSPDSLTQKATEKRGANVK